MIGHALGNGLAKNFIPPEQLVQRNQLQQAFQKVRGLANNPNASQLDLTLGLMEAGAGIPGSERYLATLLPQILERTNAGQYGNSLSPNSLPGNVNPSPQNQMIPEGSIAPSGNIPNDAAPSNTPINRQNEKKINAKDSKDIENLSNQYLQDMRPDLMVGSSKFSPVPTFDFEMKSDLRPEEEAQIRQKLFNEGKTPQVIDNVLNRLREDVKTRFNEALKSYDLTQDQQNNIRNKWTTFRQQAAERLSPHLNDFGNRAKEDLTNKYFQYAGNQPINLTPEAMHTNSMENLRRDMNRIHALEEIPSMPFARGAKDVDDYLNANKEAYKSLVEEGFYETVKEDAIQNKDMGIEELHQSIWGDQTNKANLNRMSVFQAPERYTKDNIGREKINKDYPLYRETYVNNLAKQLKHLKPEDDLILLRGQVLNSKGTEKDFTDALSRAQEKGLKLSPFQENQMQELRIPRIKPLWEIFNPAAWSNWINALRGKK
jgi:hypothetical protein